MQCSRSFAALALLALLACGGSSQTRAADSQDPSAGAATGDESKPPAEKKSDEERLNELFESLAGDLRGAADCESYAADLDGWMKAHADEVRTLTDRVESRRQEVGQEDVALYDRQLVNAIEVVLVGAGECVEHDSAQAAFDAFDELLLGS